MIHLTASEDAVLDRLMARGRQDDTKEAITARFKEYEQAILPILEDFKKHGVRVIDVDGNQPIETVHSHIVDALNHHAN